jgi:hypothetical protein
VKPGRLRLITAQGNSGTWLNRQPRGLACLRSPARRPAPGGGVRTSAASRAACTSWPISVAGSSLSSGAALDPVEHTHEEARDLTRIRRLGHACQSTSR